MLQAAVFTATPRVVPGMESKSPIDFFRLLFEEHVMKLLHTETLCYMEQYLERENFEAHEWRRAPFFLKELEVFLTLIIAMGICGFPTLRYVY